MHIFCVYFTKNEIYTQLHYLPGVNCHFNTGFNTSVSVTATELVHEVQLPCSKSPLLDHVPRTLNSVIRLNVVSCG